MSTQSTSNPPGSLEDKGSSFKFDLTQKVDECAYGRRCTDIRCSLLHNYLYCQEYMNGTPERCKYGENCKFLRVSRGERALYITKGQRTEHFQREILRTGQLGGLCQEYIRKGHCEYEQRTKRKCTYQHVREGDGVIECVICTEKILKEQLTVFLPCAHVACKKCVDHLVVEHRLNPPLVPFDQRSSLPLCFYCKQQPKNINTVA